LRHLSTGGCPFGPADAKNVPLYNILAHIRQPPGGCG
jgi:hypothetical protein